MAEFDLPFHIIPEDATPEQAESWRQMMRWMAQQAQTVKNEILQDKRFSDERVAHSLSGMQNDVMLNRALRPNAGDVLYAIDGYNAAWGAPGAPSPSDPGTGPAGVGDHNLLDGDVHPDTVLQGSTKGSLIVGNNSSPSKWDELAVGTNDYVLTADSTQTLGVKWASAVTSEVEDLILYGDGVDGTHTMDGSTDVTGFFILGSTYYGSRDVFFENLTIDSGVSLNTSGMRIYVSDTLTIDGEIEYKGSNGATGTAAELTGVGGAGGVALAQFAVGGSTAGTNGRTATLLAGGTAAAPGAAAGEGGDGGGGGRGEDNAGGVNTGGAAGAGIATNVYRFRTLGRYMDVNAYTQVVEGGTGGRGGSAGAGDGAKRGAGGGGGGAGGAVIFIVARHIVVNGSITADGGDGGTGGAGTANCGAGGGGGGGGGGFIYIIYDTLTGSGTITAAGGAAGAAGANGTTGADATAGTAGADGNVVKYCRLTGVFS